MSTQALPVRAQQESEEEKNTPIKWQKHPDLVVYPKGTTTSFTMPDKYLGIAGMEAKVVLPTFNGTTGLEGAINIFKVYEQLNEDICAIDGMPKDDIQAMKRLLRLLNMGISGMAKDYYKAMGEIQTSYTTTEGDEIVVHGLPRSQAVVHKDCERWKEYVHWRTDFIKEHTPEQGVEKLRSYCLNPPSMPEDATLKDLHDWNMRLKELNGYIAYMQDEGEASLQISEKEKRRVMEQKIPDKVKYLFGHGDFILDWYHAKESKIFYMIVRAIEKANGEQESARLLFHQLQIERAAATKVEDQTKSSGRSKETKFKRTAPCTYCGKNHVKPDNECWENPSNPNNKLKDPDYMAAVRRKKRMPNQNKSQNPTSYDNKSFQKEIHEIQKQLMEIQRDFKGFKSGKKRHHEDEDDGYISDAPSPKELSKNSEYD
jgi:hypothetical protein